MERMGKCNKKILEIGIQKVEQAGELTRPALRQLEEAKNLNCLHCRVFTAQALVVISTDDVEMSWFSWEAEQQKQRLVENYLSSLNPTSHLPPLQTTSDHPLPTLVGDWRLFLSRG